MSTQSDIWVIFDPIYSEMLENQTIFILEKFFLTFDFYSIKLAINQVVYYLTLTKKEEFFLHYFIL